VPIRMVWTLLSPYADHLLQLRHDLYQILLPGRHGLALLLRLQGLVEHVVHASIDVFGLSAEVRVAGVCGRWLHPGACTHRRAGSPGGRVAWSRHGRALGHKVGQVEDLKCRPPWLPLAQPTLQRRRFVAPPRNAHGYWSSSRLAAAACQPLVLKPVLAGDTRITTRAGARHERRAVGRSSARSCTAAESLPGGFVWHSFFSPLIAPDSSDSECPLSRRAYTTPKRKR
jgi:hypothetical protein